MRHWLRLHWLSFIATLKYVKASPVTVCLNMVVIALAVTLPLGWFVLLSSAKTVVNTLPIEPQLTVFMHRDISKQERHHLQVLLQNQHEVASVHFVSKEEGLTTLAQHSGLTNLLGGLPDNPLPDAFTVTLTTTHPDKMDNLQKKLSEESGVEFVLADSAWAKRLTALFTVGEALLKVLTVVLGVSVILITGNSIRMQILTRIEEIEVSKLIGATDAFIRRPFIYFGVLQGIVGSLLAYGLIEWMLTYINPSVRAVAMLYNTQFSLQAPSFTILAMFCGITALLCLIGAAFSVQRHLRQFS